MDAWWRANRHDATTLFAEELRDTQRRLAEKPDLGLLFIHRGGVAVRRLLMERTRNHVYYEVDESERVVMIVALWGAVKGSAGDFEGRMTEVAGTAGFSALKRPELEVPDSSHPCCGVRHSGVSWRNCTPEQISLATHRQVTRAPLFGDGISPNRGTRTGTRTPFWPIVWITNPACSLRRAPQDSNLRPADSKSDALSS